MELINQKKSSIQDDYIEKYLAEKDLNLTATLDAKATYKDADFVVIAAPTNYDSKKNFFDTLNQLTTLDIRVLGMYGFNDDDVYKVMNDFNVDNDELNTSKEKLVRFGLLLRKNDLQRDENLDGIAEYLTKIDKESKKTKPSTVRLPSIKKISNSKSYKISSLGWKYLRRLGMTQF